MTKALLKITTLVMAFGFLHWSGNGLAAQAHDEAAARETIAVRLPLSARVDGVDGYLELRQDARLTPKLTSHLWGTGDTDIGDDPALVILKDGPLRNALIQVVDRAGKVLDAKSLERPLAKLKVAQLTGDSKPTYLLTVDYSAGFGSYSGPITNLVEVKNGRLQWVEAADSRTGKSEKISLMESLKTTWKFEDAPDSKGKQILLAECRPDWSSTKDDPDFRVTYARFYFDGTKWFVTERTVKGFAEFDQGFPSRINFP